MERVLKTRVLHHCHPSVSQLRIRRPSSPWWVVRMRVKRFPYPDLALWARGSPFLPRFIESLKTNDTLVIWHQPEVSKQNLFLSTACMAHNWHPIQKQGPPCWKLMPPVADEWITPSSQNFSFQSERKLPFSFFLPFFFLSFLPSSLPSFSFLCLFAARNHWIIWDIFIFMLNKGFWHQLNTMASGKISK